MTFQRKREKRSLKKSCFDIFADDEEQNEGTDEEAEDGEEEEEEEEEGEEEEEEETHSTARPRRMSELHIPSKVKPIPPASSLFLFSSTNRYCYLHSCAE